jgi:uncharacterized protein (DUF427 family)
MSLTAGTGPFSKSPAGRFDFDAPQTALYWDPVQYRIRTVVGGQCLVDSRNARLLHETGHLPVYYFPRADVREDALVPSDKRTHCPHKGDAGYWSVRGGGRVVPDAVWAYQDPIAAASFLRDHVALYWHAADEWFVEDAQAFGHPRDPYHRIDVYPPPVRFACCSTAL